jgi:hypothetical protein
LTVEPNGEIEMKKIKCDPLEDFTDYHIDELVKSVFDGQFTLKELESKFRDKLARKNAEKKLLSLK